MAYGQLRHNGRRLRNGRIDARRLGGIQVEHVIQLHIEKLPEGMYLATSDEVQGLVAQGRTIQETIEIARDVVKKLIEAQTGEGANSLPPARDIFD